MNLQEIKKAVDNGKTVCCNNDSYVVIKNKAGEYLIKFLGAGYNVIGLTWNDDITLNDKEENFYIKP